jgi:plasmid stability protein
MATVKSERPISVLVRPDLEAVLRARAVSNHRSLTKEVVFLIETALGCSSENVRETIHLLYKAGVEVTPEATSPLA